MEKVRREVQRVESKYIAAAVGEARATRGVQHGVCWRRAKLAAARAALCVKKGASKSEGGSGYTLVRRHERQALAKARQVHMAGTHMARR